MLRLLSTRCSPLVRTSTISKMASHTALYSTASLKAQNAQTYESMAGRLQQPLLKALDSMGYE